MAKIKIDYIGTFAKIKCEKCHAEKELQHTDKLNEFVKLVEQFTKVHEQCE